MASYEKVVRFEDDKPAGVIRLVEANGFYRAYNHGAYLFQKIGNGSIQINLIGNFII